MRKLFTVFMALVLSLTYSSPVLAQSATPVATSNIAGISLTDGQATALRTDLLGRLYVNVNNTITVDAHSAGFQGTQGTVVATSANASSLIVSCCNATCCT
jgi:hypothetical protein